MAKMAAEYLELIYAFPLRPIKSDRDLKKAEKVLHQLLDADTLTAAEKDYLDVLGGLIEEYEAAAHPIEAVSPAEMLQGLIESKGVTKSEVAKVTGIPVSTISELASETRGFTLSHVEKLCAYFGIGPSAFIQTTKETTAAR